MTRFAAGVEFDGSGFAGWQLQQDRPTIQGAVQSALATVLDHPVVVTGAGRTDAGVHARCLVLHFDSPARRTDRALLLGGNSHLPPGIALRWVRQVPDHFHARYSALARTYRYCILNRPVRGALSRARAAFIYRRMEVEPMREAALLLLGTHDFSAFRAAECQARSPVRELRTLRVERRGEFVILEVTANAFLHHMVRNIAGLLVHVGQGEAPPGLAGELLEGRDRRVAPATAPAEGLYFWRAHYPSVFGLPDDSDIMPPPTGCPGDLLDCIS